MTRWIIYLSLFAFIGCGEAVIDHSRDPERFAKSIKELVEVCVTDARSSREPADILEGLVRELDAEELSYRPTGDYMAIYQELHAVAREAFEAAQGASGPSPGLSNRLDKLREIAVQLPGEIREITAGD